MVNPQLDYNERFPEIPGLVLQGEFAEPIRAPTLSKNTDMDWVHLHLALNHLPVWGTLFVLFLLLVGMFKSSDELKRLALWWTVILAALSIPIKFTGDFAVPLIETQPWLDSSLVSNHEQAADQATTGVFLMGLAAALGLYRGRGKRDISRAICITILVLTLLTFLLMARTANLGGQIRHEEIRDSASVEL